MTLYTEVGMSGTDLLGEFEHVVLLAILQHREDGYAILNRRAIEDETFELPPHEIYASGLSVDFPRKNGRVTCSR